MATNWPDCQLGPAAEPGEGLLMGRCVECGGSLSGRQTKFCSRVCKNRSTNANNQSYDAQQARGLRRKIRLVRRMGCRCQQCGYGRNLAALEFHHSIPATKSFSLDLRSLSNRSWRAIESEVRKCELLCSNCHKEVHNPQLNGLMDSPSLSGMRPFTARARKRH